MTASALSTWLKAQHLALGLAWPGHLPALDAWLAWPVTRTEASATLADGEAMALDVYRPDGPGPWPAVLLVEGFDEAGTRAPRIVSLARLIARAGMIVVVPDLVEVFQYEFSLRTPERIDAAFTRMRALPDVDPARLVMFGISVAGGFAIAAATRESIARHLSVTVGFAPFYHARNAVEFMLTGRYRHGDAMHDGTPHVWTRYIFFYNFMELVVDPANADFDGLRAVMRRRVGPDREAAEEAARQLSPAGQALLHRLDHEDGAFFAPLVGRALKQYPEMSEALSPHANLHRLRGQLFLIHDRRDTIIPFSESLALADAARSACPDVACEVLITDSHGHAEPRARFEGLWRTLSHDLPEMLRYSSFLTRVFRAIVAEPRSR